MKTIFNLCVTSVCLSSLIGLSCVPAAAQAPASGPVRDVPGTLKGKEATGKQGPVRETVGKPLWSELTDAQRTALAPLASEWNRMEHFRKDKWLAISRKFASMSPEEQQRLHSRMRDWVALTPEQRRLARENYARAKVVPAERKSAEWEQYQQLPDEQKKKLAGDVKPRKRITALPRHAYQAHPDPAAMTPTIKPAAKPEPESRSSAPQDQPSSVAHVPAPAEDATIK